MAFSHFRIGCSSLNSGPLLGHHKCNGTLVERDSKRDPNVENLPHFRRGNPENVITTPLVPPLRKSTNGVPSCDRPTLSFIYCLPGAQARPKTTVWFKEGFIIPTSIKSLQPQQKMPPSSPSRCLGGATRKLTPKPNTLNRSCHVTHSHKGL